MGKRHFIGMSGLRGYLPNYTCLTATIAEAVDDLDNLHELTKSQRSILTKQHFVSLTQEQGAEYAEIHTCDCDEPQIHSDN